MFTQLFSPTIVNIVSSVLSVDRLDITCLCDILYIYIYAHHFNTYVSITCATQNYKYDKTVSTIIMILNKQIYQIVKSTGL